MGFILVTVLILALVGIYGFVTSVTHFFPCTSASILWGLLGIVSVVPILLFTKLYLEMFYPEILSHISSKKEVETIKQNPIIKSSFEKLSSLPEFRPGLKNTSFNISCQSVRVDRQPPHNILQQNSDSAKEWQTGFVIKGYPQGSAFLLVNNDEQGVVEKWTTKSQDNLIPIKKEKIPELGSKNNWTSISIVDAAAAADAKIILAVEYWQSGKHNALYILDLETELFTRMSEEDITHEYIGYMSYFNVKRISPDSSIFIYYSNRVRAAAEVYYNYFNHVMLVSPRYPTGVELLRLSIETGNIETWFLREKTLYIKTVETREPQEPKIGYWSVNIADIW